MQATRTTRQYSLSRILSGKRLGKYEVLARIASGGMASVYVARSMGMAGFERLFAIKVLHSHLAHQRKFVAMFLDEAKLAAKIRHANVLSAIDVCDTPDAEYYLVMDYIEGDHLGALLRAAGQTGSRIPVRDSLRIIVDALTGLAAAHDLTDESGRRLNLIHRDISPQNILVGTDGVSQLTDFGVAKAENRITMTLNGELKGKLAYMAPERVFKGHVDQRSDLFAMGVVLWECITGRRLFRAENQAATLDMICNAHIAAPSTVDPELALLDPVMEKALSRNPYRRFQTAVSFMDAIENAAVRMGGLASRRSVADSVKTFAQEKLSRDRKLIQNAIATRDIAPATDTPIETMEGNISHIRIKSVGDDSTVQFRNLKKARNAAEADIAQELVTGLLTKISRLPKLAILQRVKRKWLISGIAGSVIMAIALALVFSLLSKSEPITTRSLEQAEIKPSFSNRPKEGLDAISTKQPTTDRARSDAVEKESTARAKQRSRRDFSRKNKSSRNIFVAQKGNRNASSNRRDRRVRARSSLNITDTHGIADNPVNRSRKQALGPHRLSGPRLRTASSRDISDNPFKQKRQRKRSLRKKKKTSSRTASGGRTPDNPSD